MLPHKKNDPSILSVPVSRVGSSQRLNQLSSQGGSVTPNSYNSIPSTPNAYVSSSLNPTKNTRGAPGVGQTHNKEDLTAFEGLTIVEKIKEFEQILTNFSSKISSFQESELAQYTSKLININDIITSEVGNLWKHQSLGNDIASLEDDKSTLDSVSKHALRELISYRNELKKLPRLPSSRVKSSILKGSTDNKVDVNEVLKYALKLSKFTKAPPTVANVPFQIHPNNYVWPAEDALRRGMLALSSIRVEDVINAELGDDVVSSKNVEEVEKEEKEEKEETEKESKEERSSKTPPQTTSKNLSRHQEEEKKQEDQSHDHDLDLDLFDPDDEDMSD